MGPEEYGMNIPSISLSCNNGEKMDENDCQNSNDNAYEKMSYFAEIFMSIYIFVRILGFGAYGTVNLMRNDLTGDLIAVKILKKRDPVKDAKILHEIKLGMSLESQYICKVHNYFEDDEQFYIIMDYLEGMDLCDFIRKDPTFFIKNHNFFWFVIKYVLHGLAYLHLNGIAHMDIKPENVFLLFDNQGNIIGTKLIDLGLSISINEIQKCFRGTDSYMAPEFFSPFYHIECKVDIWSLGIMAFTMLMAYLPNQIRSRRKDTIRRQNEIYKKIENLLFRESFNPFEKRSEDPHIAKLENFILSCLITFSDKRPSAEDLLKTIPINDI